MRKSVTDRISDRLKQLEVKTAMPVAVMGEDFGLRSPRELTCMAFGGNISEEEFSFLHADPRWKAQALDLLAANKQYAEALRGCLDSMSEPAQADVVAARRNLVQCRYDACSWLKHMKLRIRQQESKRIRDWASPPMNFDQWGK